MLENMSRLEREGERRPKGDAGGAGDPESPQKGQLRHDVIGAAAQACGSSTKHKR